MYFRHKVLGACLLALATTQASAQLACDKSYGFRADVSGTTGTTICASKAQTFLDALQNFNSSNLSYTPTSAATAYGRVNDVNISFGYATGSNTLTYSFPELGYSGSFTGATRADSGSQFGDFVKKNDIIGKIMRYQAEHSATSPISGVGGLIPTMASTDFNSSFDTASKVATGETGINNLIGLGLAYGNFKIDNSGDKVTSITIPLSYTVRNDIDPRRQLVISMPLTQVSVGDAKSYHAGLGVAYRVPVNDNWTLTPGARFSAVGSVDRATVAAVTSLSMMSTYVIPMANFDVAIGNMLGYYQTAKFSSGDYSFNPDIKQTMMRNGAMLSQPVMFGGQKMAIEYALIDTRYLSNKPYVDNMQELSVTLGTNRNATNARSFIRTGLSYLRGRDSNGFGVNLGYWF